MHGEKDNQVEKIRSENTSKYGVKNECKEVLFGITFNSKIPEMLILQSDTLREGEKKT